MGPRNDPHRGMGPVDRRRTAPRIDAVGEVVPPALSRVMEKKAGPRRLGGAHPAAGKWGGSGGWLARVTRNSAPDLAADLGGFLGSVRC